MKKGIISILLCGVFFMVSTTVYASVQVDGYFRKDGTYVPPHHRSEPDGNFYNNWSTEGNINPYTGEEGTKTLPETRNNSTYSPGYSPPSLPSIQIEEYQPPSINFDQEMEEWQKRQDEEMERYYQELEENRQNVQKMLDDFEKETNEIINNRPNLYQNTLPESTIETSTYEYSDTQEVADTELVENEVRVVQEEEKEAFNEDSLWEKFLNFIRSIFN